VPGAGMPGLVETMMTADTLRLTAYGMRKPEGTEDSYIVGSQGCTSLPRQVEAPQAGRLNALDCRRPCRIIRET